MGSGSSFYGGPKFLVREGESLHIRDESLKVFGEQFTPIEMEKIEKVKAAGFKHWFLSYVQSQKDVDEFRKLVGDNATVNLKIEDKKGLEYVRTQFVKTSHTNLVMARGDMYVELERPHEILNATRLLLEKDPDCICGSRLLLSTIQDEVPSCADWCELAWMADLGYRNMMLCDELCLKEEFLARAVNAFQAFRDHYKGGTQRVPIKMIQSKPRPVHVAPPEQPVKSANSVFGRSWAWFNGRARST